MLGLYLGLNFGYLNIIQVILICSPSLEPNFHTLFSLPLFIFKDFVYFILERGGERKRGRETSMCDCLSHAPYGGLDLQPKHVPWLGIEPVTPWFAGWRSIHSATPARTSLPLDEVSVWGGKCTLRICLRKWWRRNKNFSSFAHYKLWLFRYIFFGFNVRL